MTEATLAATIMPAPAADRIPPQAGAVNRRDSQTNIDRGEATARHADRTSQKSEDFQSILDREKSSGKTEKNDIHDVERTVTNAEIEKTDQVPDEDQINRPEHDKADSGDAKAEIETETLADDAENADAQTENSQMPQGTAQGANAAQQGAALADPQDMQSVSAQALEAQNSPNATNAADSGQANPLNNPLQAKGQAGENVPIAQNTVQESQKAKVDVSQESKNINLDHKQPENATGAAAKPDPADQNAVKAPPVDSQPANKSETAKLDTDSSVAQTSVTAPDSGKKASEVSAELKTDIAQNDSEKQQLDIAASKNEQKSVANVEKPDGDTGNAEKPASSKPSDLFQSQLLEKMEVKTEQAAPESAVEKNIPVQSVRNSSQAATQTAAVNSPGTAGGISGASGLNATPQSQTMTPAEQILTAVNSMRDMTTGQISLQLNPSELGVIKIRFEQSDGQMMGIVEAQRPETQKELERAMPELTASLQSQGINIGRIQVQAPNPQQQPQGDKNHADNYDDQLHREFQNESQGESRHNSSQNGRNSYTSGSYPGDNAAAARAARNTFAGQSSAGLNLYI